MHNFQKIIYILKITKKKLLKSELLQEMNKDHVNVLSVLIQ